MKQRRYQQLLKVKQEESFRARAARWFRSLSLWAAASLTLLGLAIFAAIAWFFIGFVTIGGFTWEVTSAGINRAGVTQIVLTIVAGAGAAVALVVTYRRQRRLEDGHFLEQLGSAAAQLGDEKPAVQFAGIYALAALADESADARRQQTVDVLCAYLRLPYDPTATGQPGAESRTDKTTQPDVEGVQREITLTTRFKPGEREVRATIFRVIGNHLRWNADPSWANLDFDFTGATIEKCDFWATKLSGSMSFERATFLGEVSFAWADFSAGSISFEDSNFAEGEVSFEIVDFSGGSASFRNSSFSGARVSFRGAKFPSGRVSFDSAKFSGGEVAFDIGDFAGGRVSFFRARFSGGQVSFDMAKFSGGVTGFEAAEFEGGTVSFRGAEFIGGDTMFRHAKFSGSSVDFRDAVFEAGTVSFQEAKFSGGNVDFREPKKWTAPPVVRWQDGRTPVPNCVLPMDWPPQVAPESAGA